MKIFKLSMLVLGFAGFVALGCGSSGKSNPDASPGSGGSIPTGTGGTGGSGGIDGGSSDVSMPADLAPPGEANPTPSVGCGDCAGLTPAQCQDCIINQTPDGVLIQDPGPNPAILYPACTAG